MSILSKVRNAEFGVFGGCLKYFREKRPQAAIRYSRRGYTTDGGITNLPLYLAGMTKKLI